MFEQIRNIIAETLSCDLEAVTPETWRRTPWTPWS